MCKAKLKFSTITMPAASLGKSSPLADIGNDPYIRAPIQTDGSLNQEEAENLNRPRRLNQQRISQ